MDPWKPLIVCTGPDCTFGDLIVLAQNLITDLILLSTILAVAVFAFAGIKLITSGGSEGARKEAIEMFRKVLIGYLWILGAWLLVYTITNVLLKTGYSFLGPPR